MRKLLMIFALVAIAVGLNAQTVVKEDKVLTYTYADTLVKDSSFNNTYYAKDFFTDARLQFNSDSLETGYTKLHAIGYGSLNYSDWFALGDTAKLSAVNSDSATVLWTNFYYDYLKIHVIAVDSVQNSSAEYNLLMNVNE